MKKILLVLWASVLTLQESNAQSAEVLWENNLNYSIADVAKTLSGYALAVNEEIYFYGRNRTSSKLIFTDIDGKVGKEMHLSEDIYGVDREVYRLMGEKDGYIIFGIDKYDYFDFPKKGENGVWIMKTDCNGYEISTKFIDFNQRLDRRNKLISYSFKDLQIMSVLPVSDGYLITVKKTDPHIDKYEGIIIKVNKSGEEQWRTILDKSLGGYCIAIREDLDQNYIFITQYEEYMSGKFGSSYLLKVNKDGINIENKEIKEMYNALSEINYVRNKSKKLLFSYKIANNKLNIIEINEEGEKISNLTFIGENNDKSILNSLETADGFYLLSENTTLTKINKQKKIIWKKTFTNDDNNTISFIKDLGSNEYILVNKYKISKIKDSKFLGIENQTNKEEQIILYPNPVDAYLNIKIPTDQKVKKIFITDITGKIILQEYKYLDKIDMSMFIPGIYILKIESESDVYVQKILKN
ncbi:MULTISPECIES: T9SS type A sorting domain-containing protein [unclassified Apibacter]|uniref:T9SS type A sorting domain-containing protein n=1 Tax=unclassified Apibacter TaxID=2630820 RepID=UPI001327685A|nr:MULTISPECIES: T9SS type A sorting domain-containing protein [unclassified Apibacter]MCX8676939.1 T9SS type A sorting domain-containing protein [Apibacter sp. B3919]MXO24679.1 T9SS type A sorting domain-containing protein [Apibacter sp. B3924]MXO25923.1 T9SS type A sorting domain-containing protein [Apibacter sp. B3813]MXO27874.1 T9SS type A sorting domain-containing protein [Apibacter sp. B3913]MXO29766.1 T9SS type A sorting domain-containing protein [Apibacter sp. B3912]